MAQYLDEQLCKEIDETLTRANIHIPPPSCVPGQSLDIVWPQVIPTRPLALMAAASPPPQLPVFQFDPWDLHDFPQLLPARPRRDVCPSLDHTPARKTLPHDSSTSCTYNEPWRNQHTRYWDLSHLPEDGQTWSKHSLRREIQLWQPDFRLKPKQQSRFFPPSTSASTPAVKLPLTRCTLHQSDDGLQDPVTTAWSSLTPQSTKTDFLTAAVEQAIAATKTEAKSYDRDESLATAANLSQILTNGSHGNQHQPRSVDQSEDGGVALALSASMFVHEAAPCAELDGREVPYVHGNSLTGQANDTATYHTYRDAYEPLVDSAVHLLDTHWTLDSELSAVELAAMPWPLTARSSSNSTWRDSLNFFPPIDNAEDVHTNTDADDLNCSVAHFESEQALFEEIATPLPETPPDSRCDLDVLLSMGHAEHFWCRDSDESLELLEDADTVTPLTEEDEEGWTIYSTDNDHGIISAKLEF